MPEIDAMDIFYYFELLAFTEQEKQQEQIAKLDAMGCV